MTTSFCVVGSPIEHSLSPLLHTAAYSHLGLDFDYDKQEVIAGDLAKILNSGSYAGVSVTMPLKQEAFALATNHDNYSVASGVANTLFQANGTWSAANTDVYGITQALATVAAPKQTLIIGSGATARSALVALADKFPQTVVAIISRHEGKSQELVAFAESLGFTAGIKPGTSQAVLEADLIMSLVPAGSFTELWSEIAKVEEPKTGTLFDVAYNPWPSKAALAWGTDRVISGIEMLIWQAIEQIKLFASSAGEDRTIDRDSLYQVMKSAVSDKL
jgi:shikimate dehydrogenase